MSQRDLQWSQMMRAGLRGNAQAYRQLFADLAPVLRGMVRRTFAQNRLSNEDVEDVVQETLLALHLKRHTWDEREPLMPWVRAIARNKVIDSLRRHGKRIHVSIDDFCETLADERAPAEDVAVDAAGIVARLSGRDREIVVALSLEGASARDVAHKLGMSEGAVRVALHRALRTLAKTLRSGSCTPTT